MAQSRNVVYLPQVATSSYAHCILGNVIHFRVSKLFWRSPTNKMISHCPPRTFSSTERWTFLYYKYCFIFSSKVHIHHEVHTCPNWLLDWPLFCYESQSSSSLVPKISLLSGKHFHSLLQCDACLEILFPKLCLWWKHCGQILLICRNQIQNGKRRKGKEGRCHSWRWIRPRRPFLWGEAQASPAFVHKPIFVKRWNHRLPLSFFSNLLLQIRFSDRQTDGQ